METKSVTIRLPKDLVQRLDFLAGRSWYYNRTYVIERALRYALDNPPAGGICAYQGSR